jgi:hypothetical protein
MNTIQLLKKIRSDLAIYEQLNPNQRKAFLKSLQSDAQQFVRGYFLKPTEEIKDCTSFIFFEAGCLVQAHIHEMGKVGVVIDMRLGFKVYSIKDPLLGRFVKTRDRKILWNATSSNE